MNSLHVVLPFPLGDQVAFSGVIRELRRQYPRESLEITLDVPVPEVWYYNRNVTLSRKPRGSLIVEFEDQYTIGADTPGRHMSAGFAEVLGRVLGAPFPIRDVRGEVFLSPRERRIPSPVAEAVGEEVPYWIICNGGKFDRTVKWWPDAYYQAVVDAFRGRIQFVQVGSHRHYHPRIEGALDLRGWTSIRSLIRLVYRAEGVLCPITGLMHLAAAVPRPHPELGTRPCIVVGGAIEPPHWSAYPGHIFLSNIGALECSGTGCWRSRVRPLGDGTSRDEARELCLSVDHGHPRCMRMIEPGMVIAAIEQLLAEGICRRMEPRQVRACAAVARTLCGSALDADSIQPPTIGLAMDRYLAQAPESERPGTGRGIVSLATGGDFLASAWIQVRLLRELGCDLPVELHVDDWMERNAPWMGRKFRDLNCRVVKLRQRREANSERKDCFAMKSHLIRTSSFAEVLWMDADCFPLANPEPLFEWGEYLRTGIVLWPDLAEFTTTGERAWRLFGLEPLPGFEAQGGVILVDRRRCSRALSLADWCNEHHKVFYNIVYGDKDLLRLACWKTKTEFHMPEVPAVLRERSLEQVTAPGLSSFSHRVASKFRVEGPNRFLTWFPHEQFCHAILSEFRKLTGGKKRVHRDSASPDPSAVSAAVQAAR